MSSLLPNTYKKMESKEIINTILRIMVLSFRDNERNAIMESHMMGVL